MKIYFLFYWIERVNQNCFGITENRKNRVHPKGANEEKNYFRKLKELTKKSQKLIPEPHPNIEDLGL